MIRLVALSIPLLIGTLATAQDRCADWHLNFRSKPDCEEAARAAENWNQSCLKAERDGGILMDTLSAKDYSKIAFCYIESAKETTKAVLDSHKSDEQVQAFWKTWRNAVLSHWEDTRDAYCMFHPAGIYLSEGDHVESHCPANAQYAGIPDRETLNKLFFEDQMVSSNVMTFFRSQRCSDVKDSDEKLRCMQQNIEVSKPIVDMYRNQQK